MSRKGGSLILVLAISLFGAVFLVWRHGQQAVPVELSATRFAPTVERDGRPDTSDEALAKLVAGNTRFAFDLYQRMAAEHQGNFLLSPYGVSVVLGMTDAAAEGETASAIAKVCDYDLPHEAVPAAFNRLDQELTLASTERTRWQALQSVWTADRYQVHQSYVDLLANQFGAEAHHVDFTNGRLAANAINAWIDHATEGQIPGLAEPEMFTPDTVLALLSANHFIGKWSSPFETYATSSEPFHKADGSQPKVDMMQQTGDFAFVETPELKAIELPYAGDQLSMVVILPAGELDPAFRETLTPETLTKTIDGLSDQTVVLHLPRWKTGVTWDLIPPLTAMGLARLFTEGAAELAMAKDEEPFISVFVQRAVAEVNEAGAEMSSSTMEVAAGSASPEPPPPPPEMICDRPFVYLLRHRPTGAVLFIGEVADPTAE